MRSRRLSRTEASADAAGRPLLGRRVLKDVALFAGRDVQHALALRARWRVSPLLASHDAEDWLDDAGASIWHEGRLLAPNVFLGL